MTRKKTHEEFEQELKQCNPTIKLLGDYVNTHTKTLVECSECGKQWYATPSLLVRKTLPPVGCPHCNNLPLKHSDFVKKVQQNYPNLEVLSQYFSTDEDIQCRCKRNDFVYSVKARYLLYGMSSTKCPKCPLAYCSTENVQDDANKRRTGTSFSEQYIYHALAQQLGYDKVFNKNRTFIGMELDILLPDNNIAIEIGSWYWHSEKTHMDVLKEKECNKHKTKLYTYYEQYPRDAEKPQGFNHVECYSYSLHSEKDHLTLRRIVNHILIKINRPLFDDWDVFEVFIAHWYLNIMENRFNQFVQNSPNISLLSEYRGEEQEISILCVECGNEWTSTPRKLMSSKYQCPICAKKKAALTNARQRNSKALCTFLSWLEQNQPTLSIDAETFVNNATPLVITCNSCHMMWFESPYVTKHNKGCPFCSKRVRPVRCVETNECFISIASAQRHYNAKTISQCCKNPSKKSNGCHWEFIPTEELTTCFPDPVFVHSSAKTSK